jgi:hypothetical protein
MPVTPTELIDSAAARPAASTDPLGERVCMSEVDDVPDKEDDSQVVEVALAVGKAVSIDKLDA